MSRLGRASARQQSGAQSEDVQHKWHTDTTCGTDLVKAQEMGLPFCQTFSYAVVHFRETFQQIALQESSDTTRLSCMKDHQKSHRTHQQSKQFSVHRATDRLTTINI